MRSLRMVLSVVLLCAALLPALAAEGPLVVKINALNVPAGFYKDTDNWHVTLGDSDQDR